ncbi:MAG: peptide-methionine (S)-S-oxide reductase MsrA [Sulfuricurvum sp.]|uniref:peptide-methionine (S)-S-oxide reductase MsrA n=1 Tax=Sulfuricurvum sp. TaxID=2025608 RepID=UPI0026192FF5|nr:peptide-methionine (S)-S-oxide reductase MsrA [Sulfuricurvum sp.]MDD2829804.1 peptide-methionine (S)-S-oxide reductase MsrA [Sulfuricurvum sp.]MDD4950287.1 peptide-methionine (S)-S-oxide reductase MsrA [Sulfuricurvum sp.]
MRILWIVVWLVSFTYASPLTKAYYAGGCFWGVEYYLEKLRGVKEVHSGFMGGKVKNPTYYEVVQGGTGHLETVEVTYDPSLISYETLTKAFFEIHDPTQRDGQGPDIGERYHSAIFVGDETQRRIALSLIQQLRSYGYDVATKIVPTGPFYPAEEYHQDYYAKHHKAPYCHGYVKRFK